MINPEIGYDEPTSALDPELRLEVKTYPFKIRAGWSDKRDLMIFQFMKTLLIRLCWSKVGLGSFHEEKENSLAFLLCSFLASSPYSKASVLRGRQVIQIVDNWAKYQKQSITSLAWQYLVPMGFEEKNGQYAGFDIDLAQAVSEKLELWF